MSQLRQTSGLTTSTQHFNSSRTANSPSIKALQLEYSKLQKEPVEGFTVKLEEDTNLYKWHGTNATNSSIHSFLCSSRNFRTAWYFIRRWLFQSRHGISVIISIRSTKSSIYHENVASKYLRV